MSVPSLSILSLKPWGGTSITGKGYAEAYKDVITEERGVEDYGRLQALLNGTNVYPSLRQIFERAGCDRVVH